MTAVIIRGFGDGAKIFEENVEIEDAVDEVIVKMAKRHIRTLRKYEVHMLEFEFPGMPEDERFFRFGTDPRAMVLPVGVRL